MRKCLRVDEDSFVAPHLPGLAHTERRQRIDHMIPKRALLQEGAHRLPHVPSGLELNVHRSLVSGRHAEKCSILQMEESSWIQ